MNQSADQSRISDRYTKERSYRSQALTMLERWGNEMEAGESQPNILAMAERIGDGNGDAVFAAMFTPLAERADRILRDVRELDSGMSHLLIAKAFGYSVSDMQREFGMGRNKVQLEMEAALGAFEAMIYARTKLKAWK